MDQHGRLAAVRLTWGFELEGGRGSVHNTRIETALDHIRRGRRGMWTNAIAHGRCLVPVRAFYETHGAETVANERTGNPVRRQYRFSMPGAGAFLLAGIQRQGRLSIVTTAPSTSARARRGDGARARRPPTAPRRYHGATDHQEEALLRHEGDMEAALTRRGFVVLAASAATAFFLKPDLAAAAPSPGRYVVSLSTIGYGHLWPKALGERPAGPMGEAELARESLEAGDVLRFRQDPELPAGDPFLEIVRGDLALGDIPWRATPEEKSAVMLIVERINEGRDVWAEVASADRRTIDACDEYARIHELELDVYFR